MAPSDQQRGDLYFDRMDLSSKVMVRDHELLFAYSNENDPLSSSNNGQTSPASGGLSSSSSSRGWGLGLGYLMEKIQIGANSLTSSMSGSANEDIQRLHTLRRSGLTFNQQIAVRSIAFGLNQNCTKVIGYTLRPTSIDCIEFTQKDYKLLWSYSLRNVLNPNDQTIAISLLGQGLSVLTGFVDEQYGHALTMRYFKINTNHEIERDTQFRNNSRNGSRNGMGSDLRTQSTSHSQSASDPVPPLLFYGQCPVQLPQHIHITDLSTLRYQSYWSYYNDQSSDSSDSTDCTAPNGVHFQQNGIRNGVNGRHSKQEMDEDDDTLPFQSQGFNLQRQSSMTETAEQRADDRKEVVRSQHYIVAPFGMVWSVDISDRARRSQFVALFPLLSTDKTDESMVDLRNKRCDEIWERLYGDYSKLFPGMRLNNTCGPDGEHFGNELVTVFEPSANSGSGGNASGRNMEIPFYGGGYMLLPYQFETGWNKKGAANGRDGKDERDEQHSDGVRSSEQEDEEKQIVQDDDSEDTAGTDAMWRETAKMRRRIKQLSGGGYGYFMNDKYQVMRCRYSLQSAMARIHPDLAHFQAQQQLEEAKKIKTMIRLAFSEFRNGDEGIPRAHRLSDKLLTEGPAILSEQIRKISESILNLKLFDTFTSPNMVQQSRMGFNPNKMRLGMTQIVTKLFTLEDFIKFLKESPSSNEENNLWHSIRGSAKCEILEHREYLEIAQRVFKYITNNEDDTDHYGNRKGVGGGGGDDDDLEDDDDGDYFDDEEEYDVDRNHGDDMEFDRLSSRSGSRNGSRNGSRSGSTGPNGGYQFGGSNHAMYREKYFALKRGFVSKYLEHIIEQRGDIEYRKSCGHDLNDTFFMKIGEIKDLLKYLPSFLKRFLVHLSHRMYSNHIDGDRLLNTSTASTSSNWAMDMNLGSVAVDEGIAAMIRDLAKFNVVIKNEGDELVHQLITIRIALELFQCVMDTANQFRKEQRGDEALNARGGIRTPWNYRNSIRGITMDLCQLVMPVLDRIGPMLSGSGRSSMNSSSLSSHSANPLSPIMAGGSGGGTDGVDHGAQSDGRKLDHMLKTEQNKIYRIVNAMSRMVLDSYTKEVYLLRHGFKDQAATDAMQQNFSRDRSFLIENLYKLFPSGRSVDRWKTDLVKNSVHQIAFDYGDCEHLVTLCDPQQMMETNETRNIRMTVESKAQIDSVCARRFIENVDKYTGQFMEWYLKAHQECIEVFLCLEVRDCAVWKQMEEDPTTKTLIENVSNVIDRSISSYLNDAVRGHRQSQRVLPLLEEYSWLHSISVGKLKETANRLLRITNGEDRRGRNATTIDLDERKIGLSLAKLSVFADGVDGDDDDDGKDDDDRKQPDDIRLVQEQLLWVNGRTMLREVAPNTFDERKLAKMSKREVIEKLIRYSLTSSTTTAALDYAKLEQILILIENVEPMEKHENLSRKSLIILLIENAIRCNEMEWRTLDDAVLEEERATDPLMVQVLSRTVIHDITKYLFHRKRRSTFWEKKERRKRKQEKAGVDMSGLGLFGNNEDDDENDVGGSNANDDEDGGLWKLWKSGMNWCVANEQTDSRYCYAARAFLRAQSG